MDRRKFLQMGGGLVLGSAAVLSGLITWVPRAEAATVRKRYFIADGFVTPFIDNNPLYWRAFCKTIQLSHLDIPGDPIIAQEGDTIEVEIINTLATTHSFVIDGLVDSGSIGPGQSRVIQFPASKVGSFLFYDKMNAPYNRLIGMHGALAIMPSNSSDELYSGSPKFKKQMFWVFNDIDPAWNDAVSQGRTPSSAYKPRYFTLNGLGGRPPRAPGNGDPALDNMHDPRSAMHGRVGDRHLLRLFNAGQCKHSVHWHGNHVEWLTENNSRRPDIWLKDIVPLKGNGGQVDVIYPFESPPDAWPRVTRGTYPMHLHDEMTQTAAGGYYMFGAMTDIYFG